MFQVPVFKPTGVPAIPEALAIYDLQGVRGQDSGSSRMPPGHGKKGEISMGMEEMDDDLFYDSYQLVSDLPDRDLLEQLAEESAELSQEIYARMIQRSIEKRRSDGYENE